MLNISENRVDMKEIPVNRIYSFRLIGTPKAGKILAFWCGFIFLLFILSLFMPWTQNVRARGQVTAFTPEDRPQTIHSTIPGRIEKWYVFEGQRINKGDTIVELSEIRDAYFNPDQIERLKDQTQARESAIESTENKALALERQIVALREGLKFSLSKGRNRIEQALLKLQSDSIDLEAAKMELSIAQEQYDRQLSLYEQGLKSLTELEGRRMKLQESVAKRVSVENRYLASKNDLANSRIELNSLQADYNDKISKAESELNSTRASIQDNKGSLARLKNDLRNLEIRSSFYFITAPQSGTLVRALVTGLGETVKEGEPIFTIISENPGMAVELYVKAMDVPLLKTGEKVRLQFDGWPALVFSGWPGISSGTFGGEIAVVDRISTNGRFRILVVPDTDDIGWPVLIGVGSGVYGWALLNDVPIWYELWRQFNGFPPDMMDDPEFGKTYFSIEKNNGKAQ
jgi:multidrug resistance efflux pump